MLCCAAFVADDDHSTKMISSTYSLRPFFVYFLSKFYIMGFKFSRAGASILRSIERDRIDVMQSCFCGKRLR